MPRDYEAKRLEVLRALELLDTDPEEEFDALAAGAQHLFGARMAFISLIDQDRQWFKAKCGLDASGTPREHAFCAHAVHAHDVLLVPDAAADPRFADNPLVTGPPYIRFYAGVPLHAAGADGVAMPIGTLCVVDDKPGDPSPDKMEMLRCMATMAEGLIELRRVARSGLRTAIERNEAVARLDRVQRQLMQAERMAGIGSWRLDLVTDEVVWSHQTYIIHGLVPGESERLQSALEFYPPADRARIAEAVAACAAEGTPYDLEVDFTTARGEFRRIRTIGELEVHDGKPAALIGVIQDITERYHHEQRLAEAAHTDELTQIASRRSLTAYLDSAVARARKTSEPLAVVLLDLDHFKEVNDRLGHGVGDDVLRRTARTLRSGPYLPDRFAARLGGDEFVLVLQGIDADAGLEQGIGRLLSDLQLQAGSAPPIPVSATIGIARLNDHVASRSALLREADAALYRAKEYRRGTAAIAARSEFILPVGYEPHRFD